MNLTVWRCPETSGGVGFFDSETAVGPGVEAKASLAAVWVSGGEAKIACCCTCKKQA